MGTHHSGDGGNIPPDGDHSPDDPPDLPELPPEWGEIVIPDDASELAAEAEQVRRELAEQRANPRPKPSPSAAREPSIGLPMLIMSVAVVITLVGLFAMAWSGSNAARNAPTGGQAAEELPGIFLTDTLGQQVPIAGYAPAVILLVEACDACADLIGDVVAAAPAGVTVLAIGGESAPGRPPSIQTNQAALRTLADPEGVVRTELALGPPTNAATVVLVDPDLRITSIVPAATSLGQFRADLDELPQAPILD